MAIETDRDAAARERLSALVDGELDPASVRHACGHWRDDVEARSTWHAYQLIGDVLRSEDLACPAERDTAFLAAIRVRLQAEPVVLAPQRPAAEAFDDAAALPSVAAGGASGRRWGWAPSAVAAGFVAVAGVLVLNGRTGSSAPGRPAIELARADTSASVPGAWPVALVGRDAVDAGPPSVIADEGLIRSARLDRYLAAHKQFAGSSALGVPSGFLRNATATEADH